MMEESPAITEAPIFQTTNAFSGSNDNELAGMLMVEGDEPLPPPPPPPPDQYLSPRGNVDDDQPEQQQPWSGPPDQLYEYYTCGSNGSGSGYNGDFESDPSRQSPDLTATSTSAGSRSEEDRGRSSPGIIKDGSGNKVNDTTMYLTDLESITSKEPTSVQLSVGPSIASDTDSNGAHFPIERTPSSVLGAALVRIPSRLATAIGYEAAPNNRGGVDVTVPKRCGDEITYEGDDDDKETVMDSSSRSCCTRKVVILALLLLVGIGGIAGGLLSYFNQSSNSSNGDMNNSVAAESESTNYVPDDFAGATDLHSSPTQAVTTSSTSPGSESASTTASESAGPTLSKPTYPPTALPTGLPTLLPTALPTSLPTSRPTSESERQYNTFSFVVMGDIPYDETEAGILEGQLYQLGIDQDGNPNADDLFAVHVGDIMEGSPSRSNDCNRKDYKAIEKMLSDKCPIPILMLPGDNEVTDCDDAGQGLKYWHQSFQSLEWSWAAKRNLTSLSRLTRADETTSFLPYEFSGMVKRQDKRKENFAFLHENVLFLGLNMVEDVYSSKERKARMEDNAEWVHDQLDMRSSTKLRAVILFGHAWYDDFFDDLEDDLMAGLGGVPVLYFHGNGHVWYVDDDVYGNSPFWVMQVDQGANAPPLKVTVYGDDSFFLDETAREEANDKLFDGFIGVNRRGGRKNGPAIYVGAGSPNLIALGEDVCSKEVPCAVCEGDCDSDDDCGESLKCMERQKFETVPGCGGEGLEGWDYCYDSNP